MDEGDTYDARRSSSIASSVRHGRNSSMYRRGSNMSEASFLTDVEMAREDVFAGPVSESVPTSISAFAHRRPRADSTTSFTYYEEDQDVDSEEWLDELAIAEAQEDGETDSRFPDQESELGSEEAPSMRRKSSGYSRASAQAPLLRRRTSNDSDRSGRRPDGRTSQKIYIVTEDLTIVVAGFKTTALRRILYWAVCLLTGGIGYLVMRWLPRWHTGLLGATCPLRDCDWVVIENQWGELEVQDLLKQDYGQSLSTVFGVHEKSVFGDYDIDMDPVITQLRSIDYRYIRFCFHPLKDKFILGNTWKDPSWTDVKTIRSGLDNDEKELRQRVFGKNLIDIKQKSVGQLLVDEIFHPFYVFQIASLVLWSLDQYYYYAACIFIISVVSIVSTLIETLKTMRRLRDISKFECSVRVQRNGFWRQVDSSDLVPGDIYEVTDPSLSQFPCDSLLLSGDCIVNESMLTGESVPVTKIPATDDTLEVLTLSASSMHPEVGKHMLFSGTKIVRARRPQDDKDDQAAALAMVVRTGFNTTKGALVRSMLFPKPSGFKFYRDSFRYIGVMAIIAAIGFVASLINFIRLGLAWHLIIVRALDLITIVVPPALPATLTIGTGLSITRLKQRLIFCISPQRINVGGRLDIMCFDKTGTLTEEGLDVLGLRVVQQPSGRFSDILTDPYSVLPGALYERDPTMDYRSNKAMLYTMATCHSLRSVDNELIGDPLDVKMFEFTGWQFEEGDQRPGADDGEEPNSLSPSVAKPPPGMEYALDEANQDGSDKRLELGVLKNFEFVAQLRRASVVVQQYQSEGADVFVKGAPECMIDICRPESFPDDYDELLGFYTHRGYRVIACAAKSYKRLSWLKIQKMKREEAESDLEFLGFIVFENKLKPTTTGVIQELTEANIRNVMCTGDNILTAISVARECELIDRTAHCFVPHFVEGDSRTPLAKLSWESVDNPVFQLNEHTLEPLPPPADHDASLPYDISNIKNYSIAVTGDVFRWMIDYASEKLLKRMLVRGQVFARMSPDEKHELVEKLKSIDYTCGFCGDGANDCGALKAADVGISLSEADASVAAPFTSRVFDISCVPEVIREGRAALVTSFSCFKYMSLYSAIQFTSVSFLYASASNLGDFQFLYIDLILILPLAIFMAWAGPYPILSRRRPTASLVSRKVLTPLLGQIILSIFIQAAAFVVVRQQSWFIPPKVDKNHSNSKNSENSALFPLSCYMYILASIVLSVGPPFRRSMARNVQFVITTVVTLLISSYLLFDPAEGIRKFMDLTYLSTNFKVFLLILAIGWFACAYSAEKFLFPVMARWIGHVKAALRPKRRKKRKEYKVVIENMSDIQDLILDSGWLPHAVIRLGIRRQLAQRLSLIQHTSLTDAFTQKMKYVSLLRNRPIAIEQAAANEQHYEVGTGVLKGMLGPRMKYSSCLYPTGRETLAQAEVAMLEVVKERAGLGDGMRVLDLGCGWGSAALYFAEVLPKAQITAFSNSKTQKEYIDAQARAKGLQNVEVITGDVVSYEFEPKTYDRVVSIELFEHMKNYELLMAKVARALKPDGKLFVHIFNHCNMPYDFEGGWMTTHFFTGGTMPSADLLHYFQRDLTLREQWWVNGKHYAQTCEGWLSLMIKNKDKIWPHLEETYGKENTARWYYRWQIFYMACAELFAYQGGDTWGVSHYLFEKA
ncbi:MAG: hypothetical protein M1820_000064 [Bogoriella megaspora]|nr:MAG: hypothetical protein M1820_000064 [Bogoriella megaspora]